MIASKYARALSVMLHRDQKYGDNDYFKGHVEKVASSLEPINEGDKVTDADVAVAYLHDVVTETQATLRDLRDLGLDLSMVDSVDALTRRECEPYTDYIDRVKKNRSARIVKRAELLHYLSARNEWASVRSRYKKALVQLMSEDYKW